MNTNLMDIYSGWTFNSSLVFVPIKILIGIVLCGVIFYSFLLILKLRVLKDTVDIDEGNIAKVIAIGNLALSGALSAIIFVLILL